MPDNAIYYQMAYVAVVVIYGAYAWSLLSRSRRLAERERRAAAASSDARRPDA